VSPPNDPVGAADAPSPPFAEYLAPGSAVATLTLCDFGEDLRVSGTATVNLRWEAHTGRQAPRATLHLRWELAMSGTASTVELDVATLDLPGLTGHESVTLDAEIPVPVNSIGAARIVFAVLADDGTPWTCEDPVVVERVVTGQDAAGAASEFDYEEAYRAVDLDRDHWTIVGPATRAEYESLGRGKRDQLIALGLHASSRVLDVGCGTGQLAEALDPVLGPAGRYVGTDVAAEAIEFCRRRFAARPNFRFLRNAQTSIPLEGEQFDVVYLGSVFTHMFPDDIGEMLGELRRLVADDGLVIADAFVSPEIDGYVGSRAMIQLDEAALLARFAANRFDHDELSSTPWNEHCRRVIYRLAPRR